jgi:hypothetical protein
MPKDRRRCVRGVIRCCLGVTPALSLKPSSAARPSYAEAENPRCDQAHQGDSEVGSVPQAVVVMALAMGARAESGAARVSRC